MRRRCTSTCVVGDATAREARTLHLDFGFRDVLPIGRPEEGVYLVKFACGCMMFVGSGQVLWRAGGFTLVCEHVAAR